MKRTGSIRSIPPPGWSSTPRCSRSFRKVIATWPICRRRIGYTVKRDMPGLKGAEVERLYATGAAWLAGRALDR
jgi:hypothetical protein